MMRVQALPRPPIASEAAWQGAVVETARLFGWWGWHPYDARRSAPGWVDLVLLRPPRALFVELKVQGHRPTRVQREVLALLRGCGLDARVWTHPSSWDDVVDALKPEGWVYANGCLYAPREAS